MKHIRLSRAFVAPAFIATMIVFIGCPDTTTDTPGGGSTATYTCENGTPVDGTPSGTSDVEECTACNTGFTLTEKKCIADNDSTAPTFTDGPRVDASTDTSATVTLTASEAGKLFWVLYTGSDASPDSAAALIKDASNDSSTGVQRSGTDVTVDAATEKTLTLSQLTPATPYTFYAVLQDSAGNIGAVSNKLVITTAGGSTVKYICENGTPQDGTPPGNDDVEECISCATGFTLTSEKKCLKDTTTPDFTLTVSTTTTASVVINGTVALSARVTNSGTAAADPTTLKWYSSPDATLDTGDTALGDAVTVAALAAGATDTALTTSVTAPATPGTVYYGACVTAIAGEATAANNCHSVAITVTEAPKADLTVAAPTAASTTVTRGATFTLSTTVANGGSAGAAATNLQWYSSTDATITTSDTPVGNAVNVAALNAGATSASLSSGDITADSTPGMYHYGACVAAVNDEATTSNNCSASVTITVPTIYTCSNGMPADGEPTGTADVAECKSCNSGFKLVGTTCVDTEYTCPDGTAKTGSKPTGNSDIVACQSCSDGFKLNGSAGVDNTTCVATQYTCPANGTPKTGSPSGTADQVVCERCNDGFKLAAPDGGSIGDDGTTCVATQYTCPANGTAKSGSTNTTSDQVVCERCNDGFKLAAPDGGTIGDDGTTCVATQYTCTDGTAKTGSKPAGTSDVVACQSCSDGFKLTGAPGADTTTCVDTEYTCSNGTPADGKPAGNDDVAQCKSCKSGYALNSNTLCAYASKDFDTLQARHDGNISPYGIWSDDTTMWVSDFVARKIHAYTMSTKARDTAKDITLSAGNTRPYGIWSDGTTMWVTDSFDGKLYAYALATKARDAGKDFGTLAATGNTVPAGIWSDDTTMWVADFVARKIYAYTLATKARDSTKDIALAADNTQPLGIWSDDTTMWVAEFEDGKIYAYTLATKARDSTKDITLVADNEDPLGIWSDGTTMWVSDAVDGKLYAYTLATKARDAAQDFNTLTAAENTDPTGIWSNGTTVWVADTADTALYAYNVATKARDTAQDIALAADNTNPPYGIWSNGTTVWVADNAGNKLYAYNVATKARDSTQDIALAAGNTDPYGIWSNGTTMWVADDTGNKLYAYTLATQDRESTKDITLVADNEDPLGIWSDGTTMWVSDAVDGKLYAYTLATKARDAAQDFNTLTAVGNTDPFGIWSDGATMWVADNVKGKIYAYPVP